MSRSYVIYRLDLPYRRKSLTEDQARQLFEDRKCPKCHDGIEADTALANGFSIHVGGGGPCDEWSRIVPCQGAGGNRDNH